MAKRKKKRPSKKNKYDNLSKPEDTLDFHGRGPMRQHTMAQILEEFIDDCLDRELTKVLIITGKGLHSKKGMPVVKPFVKKTLQKHPQVIRVYEGRSDRGGTGTLEVILDS
jgi:DNA-nicking Smr family endonuclease